MKVSRRLSSATKEGRLISRTLSTAMNTKFAAVARERFYRMVLGQPHRKCDTLPCISVRGDFSALPAGVLVEDAFTRALANVGGPPDFIRAIDGMSGQKYRTFINNLVGSHPDPRYLEIGSWGGSTATAALYGNSVKALCIDNWSQFGGPRATFFTNIERVLSPAVDFKFVENDFRRVDYTTLGDFNIFLFDGPHEELDQYDGIMVAQPALDKSFVLIVDDWNWRQVRLGTFRAVRDAGYVIASSVEIRTTQDNSLPRVRGKNSDWHNGYFIAVLKSVKSAVRPGAPVRPALR
jgi:hypothetical protein